MWYDDEETDWVDAVLDGAVLIGAILYFGGQAIRRSRQKALEPIPEEKQLDCKDGSVVSWR